MVPSQLSSAPLQVSAPLAPGAQTTVFPPVLHEAMNEVHWPVPHRSQPMALMLWMSDLPSQSLSVPSQISLDGEMAGAVFGPHPPSGRQRCWPPVQGWVTW